LSCKSQNLSLRLDKRQSIWVAFVSEFWIEWVVCVCGCVYVCTVADGRTKIEQNFRNVFKTRPWNRNPSRCKQEGSRTNRFIRRKALNVQHAVSFLT
jgi:hypothetical protein